MTLSQVKAWYGLKALGTPTRKGITGPVTIGNAAAIGEDLATVDVAYQFQVTAAANGDVARLDLSTGQVTQQTGTPTLTDAGVDFEGKTLPTTAKVQAVLIETAAGNVGTVTAASSINGIPTGVIPPGSKLQGLPGSTQAGVTGGDVLDLTLANSADSVLVTVLGNV